MNFFIMTLFLYHFINSSVPMYTQQQSVTNQLRYTSFLGQSLHEQQVTSNQFRFAHFLGNPCMDCCNSLLRKLNNCLSVCGVQCVDKNLIKMQCDYILFMTSNPSARGSKPSGCTISRLHICEIFFCYQIILIKYTNKSKTYKLFTLKYLFNVFLTQIYR